MQRFVQTLMIVSLIGSSNARSENLATSMADLGHKPNASGIESQFSKEDDQWETFSNSYGHYELKKPKCWKINGDEGEDPKTNWRVLMNSAPPCKTNPSPLIELAIDIPDTKLVSMEILAANQMQLIVRKRKLGNQEAIDFVNVKDYEGKKAIQWEIRSSCRGRNVLLGFFFYAEESTIASLEKKKAPTLPVTFQRILDSFRCL